MTNRFIVRLIVFALVILFGVSACQMSAPPHMPSPLDSSAGLETQSSTAFPVRRPPASGQARPATCGFKLLRTEVHSSNTLVTRYVREMPTGDRWFIWLEFRVPATGQLAYRIGRRMSIDAVAAYDDFDCYGAVANLPSECPCNIPPTDGPIEPPLLMAKQYLGEGGAPGGFSGGPRLFNWSWKSSGTNSWSGAEKAPKGITSGTARANLNNRSNAPRNSQKNENQTQPDKSLPGPKTLTQGELNYLQRIADEEGAEFVVFGSRARGTGRNIDTNLPIGKMPKDATRSDIDVRIEHGTDVSNRNVSHRIKELGDGNTVSTSSAYDRSHPPTPRIEFRPGRPPRLVE